jgi:hypothetical protein
MERRARIELATLAWKAKVIPFYERRNTVIIQQTSRFVYLFGRGDEIRTHDTDFKDQCLRPLGDTPTELVASGGLEPPTHALSRRCSTPELTGQKLLVVMTGFEPVTISV